MIITIALALLIAAAAPPADTKISLKQLPAAVQKAVQENLDGGTIKGVSTEKEKGKTFYEVETLRAGHGRDLLFDAAGQLVSVEEEVALDAVPEAARTALTARGTVRKVELVTKGQVVFYEAVVEQKGKRSEVAVDAAGKPVTP
jgi:uncharacterized membrane protein YkoI